MVDSAAGFYTSVITRETALSFVQMPELANVYNKVLYGLHPLPAHSHHWYAGGATATPPPPPPKGGQNKVLELLHCYVY